MDHFGRGFLQLFLPGEEKYPSKRKHPGQRVLKKHFTSKTHFLTSAPRSTHDDVRGAVV